MANIPMVACGSCCCCCGSILFVLFIIFHGITQLAPDIAQAVVSDAVPELVATTYDDVTDKKWDPKDSSKMKMTFFNMTNLGAVLAGDETVINYDEIKITLYTTSIMYDIDLDLLDETGVLEYRTDSNYTIAPSSEEIATVGDIVSINPVHMGATGQRGGSLSTLFKEYSYKTIEKMLDQMFVDEQGLPGLLRYFALAAYPAAMIDALTGLAWSDPSEGVAQFNNHGWTTGFFCDIWHSAAPIYGETCNADGSTSTTYNGQIVTGNLTTLEEYYAIAQAQIEYGAEMYVNFTNPLDPTIPNEIGANGYHFENPAVVAFLDDEMVQEMVTLYNTDYNADYGSVYFGYDFQLAIAGANAKLYIWYLSSDYYNSRFLALHGDGYDPEYSYSYDLATTHPFGWDVDTEVSTYAYFYQLLPGYAGYACLDNGEGAAYGFCFFQLAASELTDANALKYIANMQGASYTCDSCEYTSLDFEAIFGVDASTAAYYKNLLGMDACDSSCTVDYMLSSSFYYMVNDQEYEGMPFFEALLTMESIAQNVPLLEQAAQAYQVYLTKEVCVEGEQIPLRTMLEVNMNDNCDMATEYCETYNAQSGTVEAMCTAYTDPATNQVIENMCSAVENDCNMEDNACYDFVSTYTQYAYGYISITETTMYDCALYGNDPLSSPIFQACYASGFDMTTTECMRFYVSCPVLGFEQMMPNTTATSILCSGEIESYYCPALRGSCDMHTACDQIDAACPVSSLYGSGMPYLEGWEMNADLSDSQISYLMDTDSFWGLSSYAAWMRVTECAIEEFGDDYTATDIYLAGAAVHPEIYAYYVANGETPATGRHGVSDCHMAYWKLMFADNPIDELASGKLDKVVRWVHDTAHGLPLFMFMLGVALPQNGLFVTDPTVLSFELLSFFQLANSKVTQAVFGAPSLAYMSAMTGTSLFVIPTELQISSGIFLGAMAPTHGYTYSHAVEGCAVYGCVPLDLTAGETANLYNILSDYNSSVCLHETISVWKDLYLADSTNAWDNLNDILDGTTADSTGILSDSCIVPMSDSGMEAAGITAATIYTIFTYAYQWFPGECFLRGVIVGYDESVQFPNLPIPANGVGETNTGMFNARTIEERLVGYNDTLLTALSPHDNPYAGLWGLSKKLRVGDNKEFSTNQDWEHYEDVPIGQWIKYDGLTEIVYRKDLDEDDVSCEYYSSQVHFPDASNSYTGYGANNHHGRCKVSVNPEVIAGQQSHMAQPQCDDIFSPSDEWKVEIQHSAPEDVSVFNGAMSRQLNFSLVDGMEDVKGVATYKFVVDPAMFMNDCSLAGTTDGTDCNSDNANYFNHGPTGSIDLTPATGASAFLTRPYFLDMDAAYRTPHNFEKSYSELAEKTDITAWVEPLTGMAIKGDINVQLSFAIIDKMFDVDTYLENLTPLMATHGSVKALFIPYVIMSSDDELTDKQAQDLADFPDDVQKVLDAVQEVGNLFFLLWIVGLVIAIISLGIAIAGCVMGGGAKVYGA